MLLCCMGPKSVETIVDEGNAVEASPENSEQNPLHQASAVSTTSSIGNDNSQTLEEQMKAIYEKTLLKAKNDKKASTVAERSSPSLLERIQGVLEKAHLIEDLDDHDGISNPLLGNMKAR